MHICFIEDSLLHGGTQLWVVEACKFYLEKEKNTTVLCPEGSWISKECKINGINIVTYDYNKITSQDESSKNIWKEVLKKCDVALCTVNPPRGGFHCVEFASDCIKEESLKTVLVPKTGTIMPEYKREYYLPHETVNSQIIAISQATIKNLIHHYNIPKEKITLLYQGTEVERYQHTKEKRDLAIKKYNLPDNADPILACVGSLEIEKGHKYIIDAVKNLSKKLFKNIHLMIVGDGEELPLIEGMVKINNLEKNISFHSFTKDIELVYERVDFLVLPSIRKEGLPNVLQESMATGKPCIATDISGVKEVVINEKTGYLIKPGNVQELESAIMNLSMDKINQERLGQNAFDLVNQKFNKKIQFEKYYDFFKSIIL